MDGSIRGDEQQAASGAAQEEQSFLGEEGSSASPLGVDLDIHRCGQERTGLDKNGLALQLQGLNVAGQGWGNRDFSMLLGSEGVDEEAFAAKNRAPKPSENTTASSCFHLDAVGHTDHGASFGLKLLPIVELDPGKGV